MTSRTHPLVLVLCLSATILRGQSDSGNVWVRSVVIQGNEVTEAEVILREMKLHPGDVASDASIEEDRERVYNLQIFNKVSIDRRVDGDSVDLTVVVDERWYFYPFPVVGIRHRDWNKWYYGLGVTHQNVRGRNQKLFIEAATGYDRWVTLSFRNPRFLDSDDYYFGLYTQYAHLHPLSLEGAVFQQEVMMATLSVGKRFGYERTVVGSFGLESWRAPNDVTRRTADADGRDVFLTASLQFTDDRRFLREYPRSGSFAYVELTKLGFGESDLNLTVFRGDIRQYIPVVYDWSLALRAYTHLVTGGIIPSYRKVFYGYAERIRGQFTTKREGEGQAGGNVELRIPVVDPRYWNASFVPVQQFRTLRYGLNLALWVDAGKVWHRSETPFRVPLHTGAGFGLHAVLPYGMIARFDIGFDRSGSAEIIFDGGASF